MSTSPKERENPDIIWLSANCGEPGCAYERVWCEDELEDCSECGRKPDMYAHSDFLTRDMRKILKVARNDS